MSRRRRVIHREEKQDSRYGSPVVARLIATVMKSGKKSLAERIVYTAIEETRTGTDAVDLLRALAALPAAQRAVIVLRYFSDLTEADTAEALRCSVGTVKSRTSRAMSALGRRPELRLSDVPTRTAKEAR